MNHEDDPQLTAHVLGELDQTQSQALEARLAGPEAQQALDQTRRACRLIEQALADEPGGRLDGRRLERLREAIGAPRRRRLSWPRAVAAVAAAVLVAVTGLLALRLDQACRQRDEYAARLVSDSRRHLRDSRALDDQLMATTKRVIELQTNRDAMQEKLLALRKAVADLRTIYSNARQVPADLAFYKAMNDSANSLVNANSDDQLEQAADNTLLALTALQTNRGKYPPDQLRQRLGEANGRLDVINNVKRVAQTQRDYSNSQYGLLGLWAGNSYSQYGALGSYNYLSANNDGQVLVRNPAAQEQIGNTIASNLKAPAAAPAALSPLAVYAQDLIVQQKFDKAIEVLKHASVDTPDTFLKH